jgi:hypothetical protein
MVGPVRFHKQILSQAPSQSEDHTQVWSPIALAMSFVYLASIDRAFWK